MVRTTFTAHCILPSRIDQHGALLAVAREMWLLQGAFHLFSYWPFVVSLNYFIEAISFAPGFSARTMQRIHSISDLLNSNWLAGCCSHVSGRLTFSLKFPIASEVCAYIATLNSLNSNHSHSHTAVNTRSLFRVGAPAYARYSHLRGSRDHMCSNRPYV